MMIAYAKGARTFERHIDIDSDGVKVSPYCSLPHQIDEWFKALPKGKGDVRRAGHPEAHASQEGN